jgi:hypothetical protein
VISDDHSGDRALMPFCQMIAIHGLTIIAHHCSILITKELQSNGVTGPWTLRGGAGLPRGKPIKLANPGGRIRRMECMGAISWKTFGGFDPTASSAIILANLIVFNHHDHGGARWRGQP